MKMDSKMLTVIVTISIGAVLSSPVVQTQPSQPACDENCGDYHRFCPAVSDSSFLATYKAAMPSFESWASKKAPPETVDCVNGIFKFLCPKSCKTCTPCDSLRDEAAERESLKEELLNELTTFLRGSNCNPCTETQVDTGSDGRPICAPRFEVQVVQEGECSCWCGEGSKTTLKHCVTYEERSDHTCVEVRSQDSAKCDNLPLTVTEKCIQRTCEVDKVFEQTANQKWAESSKAVTYKAITDDNQVCDLGTVGGPKRDKGKSYTYDLNYLCNICMKSASEVFKRVDLNIAGNDAWIADHVKVTVNGNEQTYYPKVYKKGVYLKNGNTFQFVKQRGVNA